MKYSIFSLLVNLSLFCGAQNINLPPAQHFDIALSKFRNQQGQYVADNINLRLEFHGRRPLKAAPIRLVIMATDSVTDPQILTQPVLSPNFFSRRGNDTGSTQLVFFKFYYDPSKIGGLTHLLLSLQGQPVVALINLLPDSSIPAANSRAPRMVNLADSGFSLLGGSFSINPSYSNSATPKFDTLSIPVKVFGKYGATRNHRFLFQLDPGSMASISGALPPGNTVDPRISIINPLTDIDSLRWDSSKGQINIPLVIQTSSLPLHLAASIQGKIELIGSRTPGVTDEFWLVEKGATFSLESSTADINPTYDRLESPKTDTIMVRVNLKGKYKANEDHHLSFHLSSNMTPVITQLIKPRNSAVPGMKLLNGSIDIDSARWDSSNGHLLIPLYVQSTWLPSPLHDNISGTLSLDQDPDPQHQVTVWLTEKGMYNLSVPFWVELGTNFDLLDGIQASNLYSGVFMFEKDVAKFKVFKHLFKKYDPNKKEDDEGSGKNLSFTAGVYESKSTSSLSTVDTGYTYRNGTSYNYVPGKGYPYYRDTGNISATTQVRSLGLFFSPHCAITSRPAEVNGFHVFLSFYAEMLWQTLNSTYDYSKTGKDSTFFDSTGAVLSKYSFKVGSSKLDFRSSYFGFGLPILVKEDNFTFYLNQVYGLSSQRFIPVQDGFDPNNSKWATGTGKNPSSGVPQAFLTPKKNLNFFYLYQFRLNEVTYGLTFSGEIRGFWGLKGSKPVISLAVSKKFDLNRLIQTITSPFDNK